ncbi:MAG: GIY-YIG nuclease family protein [Bacteroidota bacterium]
MHFVYILRSLAYPSRHYVGRTSDPLRRLDEHNSGKGKHTAKFKPWELSAYIAFPDLNRALAFERYLKTGSGRAFARKHFEQ